MIVLALEFFQHIRGLPPKRDTQSSPSIRSGSRVIVCPVVVFNDAAQKAYAHVLSYQERPIVGLRNVNSGGR